MKTDVTFTYKNYRGEVSVRLVRPITISFGTTGFHPEPQWLLHGWDLNKEAERTFAMKDISDWEARHAPLARTDGPEDVLNGIRDALETRGYFHMANGRDIGILLDEIPSCRTLQHSETP